MAVNGNTLLDFDDEDPDWIELYNSTSSAIDLQDWYLTDDEANLQLWQVPVSTVLQPGEREVIFASQKDTVAGNGELHTNFRLAGSGEYLALVRPDGTTIESEITPTYPTQFDDVSFGFSQLTTTLLDRTDDVTYHVPVISDSGLGTTWTATGFDDSQWTPAAQGLGFNTGTEINFNDYPVVSYGGAQDTSGSVTLLDGGDTVNITGNAWKRIAFPLTITEDSVLEFDFQSDTLGEIHGIGFDTDNAISAELTFQLFGTQAWGIQDFHDYENNDPATSHYVIPVGQFYTGAMSHLTFTMDHDAAPSNAEAVFSNIIVHNNLGDVQTDVGPEMLDINSSVWTRMDFDVVDASELDELYLDIQYDDGAVVFLNGTQVASLNGPVSLTWDANAATERPVSASVTPETISLTGFLNLLNDGANTLAIQGLNFAADDGDFFLGAEITAITNLENVGFLGQPTPGEPNVVTGSGVQLSPTISVDSGVFTADFPVEITAPDPLATIRYTTDGTIPTSSSTAYAGPITITATTELRAASFRDDYVTSRLVSETYSNLANDVTSFNSDLPVLLLDTFGQTIGGADQSATSFTLFEPDSQTGRTTFDSDPTVTSRAGLKIRGSSSSGFAKKPYSLELRNDHDDDDRDISLLGMPAESDWVMHSPYTFDRAFVRNRLIYELSNQVGQYATRTQFVEVFLNSNNDDLTLSDYVGIYVIIEKIKRGADRVDVEKLPSQHVTEPSIDGGYIIKIDRADPGDAGFTAGGRGLKYVYPKEEVITTNQTQVDWLTEYIDDFAGALNAGDYVNPQTGLSYDDYIDIDTWVDHHLLNEIAKNVDAFVLSTYMYKSRGGKLVAGPIWDFDRSMESIDSRDDDPQNWLNNHFNGWWNRLFQNPDFLQQYGDRWQQLRGDQFHIDNIHGVIDEFTAEVEEAQVRNFDRWPAVSPRTSPGPHLNGTWEGEVAHLKNWLSERVVWIDSMFITPPQFSQPSGIVPTGFEVGLTSQTGTIYYTLDGSDPRLSGGGTSPNAIQFTGPITVTDASHITARVRGSSGSGATWSSIATGAYSIDSPPPLRITEVNYNPSAPTADELLVDPTFDSDDFEFIEIRNVGVEPVNLLGTQVVEGVTFVFPQTPLAANEYAVIVRNLDAFETRYGDTINVVGVFSGGLSNSGETITLLDSVGTEIHQFQYNDKNGWPLAADGIGGTLEVVNTDGNYADSNNWANSLEFDGSPGRTGDRGSGHVVINEVLSHTDLPRTDTVELYNPTNDDINIGGWFISDSETNLMKYEIPSPTLLAANTYMLFDELEFNPTPLTPGPNDFALSGAHGDEVWLTNIAGDGSIVAFVDQVEFGAQKNAESWARWPNGEGAIYPAEMLTLGTENTGPRVGPIVISEVMYHPPSDVAGFGASSFEYVEIYNPTQNAEILTNWIVEGGIEYQFADDFTMAAGEVILLVNFDPQAAENSALLDAFQIHYELAPETVLLGDYSGQLSNGGDVIRLMRPDEPPLDEPDFIPLLLEDEVRYDDALPWSIEADGGTLSLTRQGETLWGNDPQSWFGLDASPGEINNGPPTVEAVSINQGFVDPPDLASPQPSSWSNQHSQLARITVEFSKAIDATIVDVGLVNLGVRADNDPDANVTLLAEHMTLDGDTLTLDFPLGMLDDGVYQLEIMASVVDRAGQALDGNADGTPGDNYVLNGSVSNGLYRLIADWNGDFGVSVFDFTTFSYWFGVSLPTAPAYVDNNGDGGVSVFDFTEFSLNFGTGIVFPVGFASVATADGDLDLVDESILNRRPTQRTVGGRPIEQLAAIEPSSVDRVLRDWAMQDRLEQVAVEFVVDQAELQEEIDLLD
jgi:hypothetical protein